MAKQVISRVYTRNVVRCNDSDAKNVQSSAGKNKK